jgi:hypothetical protein
MKKATTQVTLEQIWGEALEAYASTTGRDPQKSIGLFKKFKSFKELLTELDSPTTPKRPRRTHSGPARQILPMAQPKRSSKAVDKLAYVCEAVI